MKTIAFFNNKGGVGKTSLVYHLAWMFADRGLVTIAADLDPQANLTSMFLREERIEAIWGLSPRPTLFGAMRPLIEGTGDLNLPQPEPISTNLSLLLGDLALSEVEDELSAQWPRTLSGDARAFRVSASFSRLLQTAGSRLGADIALIDVGPNLGAINRAALIASDYVVIPLGPDLFSVQGLRNVGPRLRTWRSEWSDRRARSGNLANEFHIPIGGMVPIGYVLMRHSIRNDRPVKAYARWIQEIPPTYCYAVNGFPAPPGVSVEKDPNCLAQLKDYRSLMPMAQDARKPMFFLKPADGAIGGHQTAVTACYWDFATLAQRIASSVGVVLPATP